MRMRFLEFKNLQQTINEKKSLIQLRDNFKKVFPNSEYKDLRILNSQSKGKDTLGLTCSGTVQGSHATENYKVFVQFHRKTLQDPWDLNALVEVKCNCNAFRYNVAYPLYREKNYAGRVPSVSMIPNRVINPQKIPTFCKHIYAYLRYLIQQKVIEM